MKYINKEKVNSYIMAMYIFQFGFLQPLASLVNSQMPIAGFSMLLLFAMLLNNRFRIKMYVVISFIVISVYFLISSLVSVNNMSSILLIYSEFLLKGFSAFVMASMTVKGKELYNAFLQLSIINFIAIALFPFIGFLDSMNYMRFGYAMITSVIMFLYASYDSKFKNPLWVVLSLVSLILTIIYGSRGPILVLLIFIFLILLFSQRVKLSNKLGYLSLSGVLVYITIKFEILTKLIDYIYFDIGIRSYTLMKLRMMLINGLASSSSGRDVIYLQIIELIKNNPITGHGIGVTQLSIDFTAHNIFLQILIESGIIGLLMWSLVWIFCIKRYVKMRKIQNMSFQRISTMLIAISMGRLLISSDMWLRPEYWFLLSFFISFKDNNIKGSVHMEEII